VSAPGAAELRRDRDGLLEAWQDDRRVALFAEEWSAPGARFTLLAREAPTDRATVAGVLDALTAHAAELELVTPDPLVRDLARRHGFTGPLRGPLAPGSDPPPGPADAEGALDAIRQLVPAIDVTMEATPGVARAWFRRTVSGVPNLVNLYAAPEDQLPPTRFAVPLRADLLVESIARCIDTTMAIRRRFGRAAGSVRSISFDHADFELLHGRHAGSADRNRGLIHMNASFASVEGLTAMETARAARSEAGREARPPRLFVPVPGPNGVTAPCNVIDGVTAHEVWHQMEGVVEARRYLDGLELRRRLGEALGVETLEQAVNGGRPRSPESWNAAHERLVAEVSPYGATTPVEATAEMFMLWWCANGERAPIVERFGELAVPFLDGFDA
jgi:hypothetical protein